MKVAISHFVQQAVVGDPARLHKLDLEEVRRVVPRIEPLQDHGFLHDGAQIGLSVG